MVVSAAASTATKQIASQPRMADSDDELDNFLPAPAALAGTKAYEALLGGFEAAVKQHSARAKGRTSKVKPHKTFPVGAQKRSFEGVSAAPAIDVNDVASSSDGRGAEDQHLPPGPDENGQAAPDCLKQQFDQSSPDRQAATKGSAVSAGRQDEQAGSAWANIGWLTSGPSLPKVC